MKQKYLDSSIDNRIERVIKSVGAKKAAMGRWESERIAEEERRRILVKRWRTYGISAAASVAVICVAGLGIYMSQYMNQSVDSCPPSMSPMYPSASPMYRGGSRDISEIQEMIATGQYDEALHAIEVTLADTIIDPTYPEERQEHLRSLNANQAYELTWLKIKALVKSDNTAKAIALLKEYVDQEGAHQEAAKDLLRKLTR